jgi:carbonic anhydrase
MTTANDERGVDLDIKDAIEGHERFRLEFERDKSFFKSLATRKQKPRLLWIGCCDSRVVPSQITSADPGELFEVRNIANCVPPAGADDDAVGAAIEYALGHLGIDDIVVCGHSGCGGIQALAEPIPPEAEAHLGRWVEYTRPAHDLIRAAGVPNQERLPATIRAHVQFQLDNLMTYEIVAKGVADGRISIHGWLYDMEQGEIQAYDPRTGAWRGLLEGADA